LTRTIFIKSIDADIAVRGSEKLFLLTLYRVNNVKITFILFYFT
jgi:hypothetical protein